MKIFISNLNESWIVDRMKEEFSNDNKTTSRFGWDTGAWVKFVEDD